MNLIMFPVSLFYILGKIVGSHNVKGQFTLVENEVIKKMHLTQYNWKNLTNNFKFHYSFLFMQAAFMPGAE